MNRCELQPTFNEFGFVHCPGFFSAEQVVSLRSEVDRFIREAVPRMPAEQVFYEKSEDQATLKQLQNLHQHDAFFANLINQGPVRQLAEQLLGHSVTPHNLQYFNKPPGVGRPTPPHQDGYYFKLSPCLAITLWLALDTVDTENGCVRYVSGSHLDGLRSHGVTGTLGFSQGITDFPTPSDSVREIACPSQPGDLLAHHALTVHRADGNRSTHRSRRALGFIYYDDRAQQDTAAWQSYQDELHQRLKEEGKI